MKTLPKNPKTKDTFYLIHFIDNDPQNSTIKSPIFNTVNEANEYVEQNSSMLGVGKMNWKLVMREESIIGYTNNDNIIMDI